MSQTFPINTRTFDRLELPTPMHMFFEWAIKDKGVANDTLVKISPHLTLSKMNASPTAPPDFIMVGRECETRREVGEEWANNVLKTQLTPVKKLNHITPIGYLKAQRDGIFSDIVEIQDANISTVYQRLIVACRANQWLEPKFFATYVHFHEFVKK